MDEDIYKSMVNEIGTNIFDDIDRIEIYLNIVSNDLFEVFEERLKYKDAPVAVFECVRQLIVNAQKKLFLREKDILLRSIESALLSLYQNLDKRKWNGVINDKINNTNLYVSGEKNGNRTR